MTSTTTTTTTQTSSSPAILSYRPSTQQKKMSLTQTYFLAHKARGKLSHEAARPDHNLRLLVGHANLLDSLMLDLADAEREQESWFNSSVRGASSPTKTEEKHIQWADTVIEEPEEDWRVEDADSDSSSSSDSESDFDEDEDVEMADAVSLRRVAKAVIPTLFKTDSYDDMEEDDDEEEDYAQLTLTRTHSHSASPPELDHDSDSSEDESMPPSPPTTLMPTFSEKQQKESISTAAAYYDSRQEQEDKDAFYDEGFYLPARNPARLVSAISVY